MYKTILFDLDGTLTESGPGITKSVQYALKKLGKEEPDLKALEVFVGPPLMEQFMKYAGIDQETAKKAVEYYREYYSVTGIFENAPYPGIREMLAGLKKRGYRLAVASAKPEEYVKKILDYFDMSQYFEEITGSEMDGRRTSKYEVIEEVLRRMKLSDHRNQVIMVGDRENDVQGAKRAGLSCIVVSYGYGSREELEKAGPLKIAASADEILRFFA